MSSGRESKLARIEKGWNAMKLYGPGPAPSASFAKPKVIRTELNDSDWLDLVVRTKVAPVGDVVPPEYKTRIQIQNIWKTGRCTTNLRIQKLRKGGYLEVKKFFILINGHRNLVPHYRIAKNPR